MEAFDAARVAEIHVYGWRSAYRGIVPDERLFNDLWYEKMGFGADGAEMYLDSYGNAVRYSCSNYMYT